ncbi:MAG: tetratricopeptide repeat protein [Aggregatilineales bacterium]
MTTNTLAEAIKLREAGQYEQAHRILQALHTAAPDDPQVNFQLAWWHDAQGLENDAVPFYEKAIANGLKDEERRGAMLGLGSTYRCLGRYDDAVRILRDGMTEFPEAGEFPIFLAMALYNTGEHHEAMTMLLKIILDTTTDADILSYRKAIAFYHDKLDETWI